MKNQVNRKAPERIITLISENDFLPICRPNFNVLLFSLRLEIHLNNN